MNRSSDAPQVLVELREVVLQQGGRPASEPLSWTIHEGEQWAIVGPINAGKRLLAEAIAGETPILQGRILWGGVSPEAGTAGNVTLPSSPSGVAYVTFDRRPSGEASFHQARWHADLVTASLSVAEALSYAGIWRRNPFEVSRAPRDPREGVRFQRRRAEVVARLELDPLLQRHLHQLSDGEWRRLQIGRALLRAPRLLILDDPLAGLDKDFRPRLNRTLSDLTAREEMQILLLGAGPDELMAVITHILVMEDGQIIFQGPREELNSVVPRASASTDGEGSRPSPSEMESAPAAPVMVHLEDVDILHNGVQVLQEVTWTVRHGEKWALIGPNGAGKSTLLSLILGDHPQAYANEVELFGHRRGSGESIWEIKRQIGWVAPELQRYHPPGVRVLDIVCSGFFDTLGINRPTTPSQRSQAKAWLDRLGVTAAPETPYYRLSKGEQRLALIARALVKDPKLLVLDEPCQGLDAAHLDAVLAALDEITADPARTLIYVTHHPREFPHGLTHVLELSGGRVVRREPISGAAS